MALGLLPASDAITWAGSIALGAVSLGLACQKLLRIWAAGTTDLNKQEGENQVVMLLRTELDRIVAQNIVLDKKLVDMILIVESLRNQNIELQQSANKAMYELSQQKHRDGTYPPERRKLK